MSKPYTLASERAAAPTGCAYIAPLLTCAWFRWESCRDSGQYLNRYDAIEDFYDKGIFNTTKAKTVLITSDEKMAHDPRVAYSILFHRGGNVHTHRTTFPFVTDMIAWRYYEKSHKNR